MLVLDSGVTIRVGVGVRVRLEMARVRNVRQWPK